MIHCHDCRVPSVSQSDCPSLDTYSAGLRQPWEHSLANLLPPSLGWLEPSATISKRPLPWPQAMRARRDGSTEMSNRHQRRFRPMIAAGIPEHWYDRLNEIGPEPGLVPFIDGRCTPQQRPSFVIEDSQMNPHSISKGLVQTKAVPRPSRTNRFPLDLVDVPNRSHSHTLCYLGWS